MGASPSPVAVVSWPYWKSRFNLDPAILGKRIVVEDVPVTVVGVTARDFIGLQVGARQDLWLPLAMEPMIRRPSYTAPPRHLWLLLCGTAKPRVAIEPALAGISGRLKSPPPHVRPTRTPTP